VRDTGVGMSQAVRARLFEPFFTTKPRGKGTGLGLYGVYRFLRAFGGAVEVDSRPGGGTTFRLYLPADLRPTVLPPPPEPIVAPDVAAAHGARILLIEDEDAIRRSVGMLLRQGGFEVVEAADGEEAVRLFAKTPRAFDLLLLDLVLPRLSGKEVLRRVRALRADVPVLLSSGNVREGMDDPEVRAGVRGVLPKPYLPADLDAAVRTALSRRAPAGLGSHRGT
jgi:CheY-like chemotaxis protein